MSSHNTKGKNCVSGKQWWNAEIKNVDGIKGTLSSGGILNVYWNSVVRLYLVEAMPMLEKMVQGFLSISFFIRKLFFVFSPN